LAPGWLGHLLGAAAPVAPMLGAPSINFLGTPLGRKKRWPGR